MRRTAKWAVLLAALLAGPSLAGCSQVQWSTRADSAEIDADTTADIGLHFDANFFLGFGPKHSRIRVQGRGAASASGGDSASQPSPDPG